MPCPRRPPLVISARPPSQAAGTARRRGDIGEVCSAVCPFCRGPMTPRLGRHGPYFYCYCHERGNRR